MDPYSERAVYLPLLTIATVLAAGALGNFIDRFFRGYVIDFIYFSLIDFPVFNLADVYVVVSGIFSDPVCMHEIQR